MARPTWDILLNGQIIGKAGQDVQIIAPAGQNVDVDSKKIVNLADPTWALDAVNLQTMQSAIAGGSDFVWPFDASSGSYPTTGSGNAGAIIAWDRYYITVGGTLNNGSGTAITVEAGDELVALVNDATDNDQFYGLQRNMTISGGDGISFWPGDVIAIDLVPTISGLEFNAWQLQVKWLADYSSPTGTNLAIGQDGSGNLVLDSALTPLNAIDGNGTTVNGSAIDLWGTITQNTTLTIGATESVIFSKTSAATTSSLNIFSNGVINMEHSFSWWVTAIEAGASSANIARRDSFWDTRNAINVTDNVTTIENPNGSRRMEYVNDYSTNSGNIDRAIPDVAFVNSLIGDTSFRQSFVDGDLTAGVITVTHSLGEQIVDVTVYDGNNEQVTPDGITLDSTTECTIDLSSYGALVGTYNVLVKS